MKFEHGYWINKFYISARWSRKKQREKQGRNEAEGKAKEKGVCERVLIGRVIAMEIFFIAFYIDINILKLIFTS